MLHDPTLTVAIALAVGILGQIVATHLRVPGIVVLLLAGVVLGPDVLGLVHPSTLGSGLTALVGFAVAVILFEGGMNLDMARIKRAGAPIRRLITVGALVTAVGATLAVHAAMSWSWSMSVLFGTLVIVTGPTVVTPLLKRLRVEREVATILEAEGVLIDPIGALIAVVALEVVLRGTTPDAVLLGLPDLALRLGVGGALGVAGGFVISRLLRVRGLVPQELVNVFTLSLVFALYQVCDALLHESGIAAVTVAGIAVRSLGTPVERELLEFKEQLTVMLIGMLFVLLAADVRLAEVAELGVPGLIVTLMLILVVRPLNVMASTVGTGLSWRQQAFLSWMAPRGIVAAAVASLFAVELDHAGVEGGPELQALVFLVIALTVVVSGLTGGLVANALGLRRPSNAGWLILGANKLARVFAKAMVDGGEDVLLIDTNPDMAHIAEEEGFRVIHGNALRETVLLRTEPDTRLGAIGLTRNEEVNLLFVQKVRQAGRLHALYVSLSDEATGVTPQMIANAHAHILFGGAHHVERWAHRLERGTAGTVVVRYVGGDDGHVTTAAETRCGGRVLPLVYRRNGVLRPLGDHVTFRRHDELTLLYEAVTEDEVFRLLTERGFTIVGSTADDVEDAHDSPREAG